MASISGSGHRGIGRGGRLWAAWGPCLAAAILLSSGCELDEGAPPVNGPPETFLFVQGDSLNTVHYRQIINWWGTDRDGEVDAYLYRVSGPWTPDPSDSVWAADPQWIWTRATRDTFDFPVDGTYAERLFEVRAVDDAGLLDPTPASQTFRLRNVRPSVEWSRTLELPTRSLPAVSFAWTPTDPDGRETVRRALIWLDEPDSASTVRVISGRDTVAAVLPAQFKGIYGRRTIKLQLIDDAATKSNVLEHTWDVVEPEGDILLIDNVQRSVPGSSTFEDAFWGTSQLDGIVQETFPGNVHVLDIEAEGGFRSGAEVLPLFQLFRAVIWYSAVPNAGNDPAVRANLETAEPGLRSYVEGGGRVLLSATNLFGTAGGLSPRFYRDAAGLDTLYSRVDFEGNVFTDFTLRSGRHPILVNPDVLAPGSAADPDTLVMQSTSLNVEFFSAPAQEDRLFWLAPGTLEPDEVPQQATREFHCGIRRRLGAGRLVLMTFPLSRAGRLENHEDVGRSLLDWLAAP